MVVGSGPRSRTRGGSSSSSLAAGARRPSVVGGASPSAVTVGYPATRARGPPWRARRRCGLGRRGGLGPSARSAAGSGQRRVGVTTSASGQRASASPGLGVGDDSLRCRILGRPRSLRQLRRRLNRWPRPRLWVSARPRGDGFAIIVAGWRARRRRRSPRRCRSAPVRRRWRRPPARHGPALLLFSQRFGHSCHGFAPENHERPERRSSRLPKPSSGPWVIDPRSAPSWVVKLLVALQCPASRGRESLAQGFPRTTIAAPCPNFPT